MDSGWTGLKDDELLQWRICDLKLNLADSGLEPRVDALYRELDTIGLKKLRPRVYLGDEWFSPEGVTAISVPFYLAHPRVTALEQKLMFEVEGGTPGWFQKLLRHETGHCFDHAYGFSRRKKWREIFGSPDQEYAPETYRPRPYSRSFVLHLDNWYSQAHPDEDFAETFAVLITPGLDWRKEYARWHGALEKLEYVSGLIEEAASKVPRKESSSKGNLPYSATRLRTTLAKHYAKRRRENAENYPDFYDFDLGRLFNGKKGDPSAQRFMSRHRKLIINSVSYWAGERKFPVEGLVRKLSDRCASLDLHVGRGESETLLELAAYLATLVTHYLFTGKFKRTV